MSLSDHQRPEGFQLTMSSTVAVETSFTSSERAEGFAFCHPRSHAHVPSDAETTEINPTPQKAR